MIDSINTNIITNIEQLNSDFIQNKPFKHAVIDNFFKKDFCENILADFPTFDKNSATNENGDVGRKAVNESVSQLSQSYLTLDKLVKSQKFIRFIESITSINNLQYDPHYFGGGTHENLNGQDLDPHVDFTNHPKTGYFRRLNFILYLNKEWDKTWGGNIELHKNPRLSPQEDDIISVEPLFNRVVLFETTNNSWHGFPKIDLPDDKKNLSRKSFALYYYTPRIDYKIKTHSTIYVERHLPKHYKVGMVLSEENLNEIKTLLTRRDQHLERLYTNISTLYEQTAGLKYAIVRKLLKIIGK